MSKKLDDLDCGDLIIKDSGDLGFDIYDQKGNKLCFINKIGEGLLLHWLKLKNQDNPSWVEKNINRIIYDRGLE